MLKHIYIILILLLHIFSFYTLLEDKQDSRSRGGDKCHNLVILGLEGLGPEGGCFLDLLDRFEGFRSNDGGGSFLLVGSLSLDWLGLKGLNLA